MSRVTLPGPRNAGDFAVEFGRINLSNVTMTLPARPFLTARWVHLAMLNYEVDPLILRALVPNGTELDFWNDRCFVSTV